MIRITDGIIGISENVTVKELIGVVNDTTKHTVNGTPFITQSWKEAEYAFVLTSFNESTGVGGNTVTIAVKVETYDPATNTWRDAMVFQTITCDPSATVTAQEYKRLVGNIGVLQRVTYVTAGAGTIGACGFKVGAVYKR